MNMARFYLIGNHGRMKYRLMLLLIVLSLVMVTITAQARQVSETSSLQPIGATKHSAKSTHNITAIPQVTWIGLGDLARVTVDNVGLIGLYEAPEFWDGTYDGTFPEDVTNWNGFVAEYPRDSRQFYLFSSGLWIGVLYPIILGADTTYVYRVATGAYTPDVAPLSPLHLSTQIIPPGETGAGDLLFVPPGSTPSAYQRLWEYADTTSLNALRRAYYGTDEYALDPADGDIVSEQDSWCVYGDWIPEEEGHFLWPSFGYDTDSLGIQVEQRSYCWGSGPQMNYIFFSYKIKNMNAFALHDLYVGFFMDADVGPGELTNPDVGPNDDLIGFDTVRNLGFTYDSNGQEPGWTAPAGYIGTVFLNTPGDMGLTAFSTWLRSDQGPEGVVDDEQQDAKKYGELVGDMDGHGHAIPEDPDPAIYETFDQPRDVRSLMASGPYVCLDPGEEVEVTVAMIAGNSLEELQENADSTQALHDRGYVVWETFVSRVEVSPRQLSPGEDVQVTAHVWDPDGILKVMASFANPPLLDTLTLYDDGTHGDGTCGDHLYGNTWTTEVSGMAYTMNLSAWDSLSNLRVCQNVASFTTLGPIRTAGYHHCQADTIPSPGDTLYLSILLENTGQETVHGVAANITAASGGGTDLTFGDIAAGDTVESVDNIVLYIPEYWSAEENIRLDLSITDSAYVTSRWTDSLNVALVDDVPPVIHDPECVPTFTNAGQAVTFRTRLVDGAGVQSALVDIESPLGTVIVDDLVLHDDGLHNDGLADDGLFGNQWTTTAGQERFYNINLSVTDNLNNQKDHINLMEFTTKPFTTTASILLVDDDHYNRPHHGTSQLYETYYMDALEANGYSYDYWDVFCYGNPPDSILNRYALIVWETGETCGRKYYDEEYMNAEAVSLSEGTLLRNYLLFQNGKLFISGQGLADIEDNYSSLLRFLGISSFEYDVDEEQLIGVTDNPIGDGLSAGLSGGGGANNQFIQSAMVPDKYSIEGFPIFQYTDYTGEGCAAMMTSFSDYGAVTFAFGFEAITEEETRNVIMDRVITWLQTTRIENGLGSDAKLPQKYHLSQNYPNPFNPCTEITYALPQDGRVKLEIYNVLGQKVAVLVDAYQKAGYQTIRWNAQTLASGIYLCRLKAGDFAQTRKMVLLK
jgi:hypothetical protein